MDNNRFMVIINGNPNDEVESFSRDEATEKCDVRFSGGRNYGHL